MVGEFGIRNITERVIVWVEIWAYARHSEMMVRTGKLQLEWSVNLSPEVSGEWVPKNRLAITEILGLHT